MPDEEEQGPEGSEDQEPVALANELAKLRRENATWRRKYSEAQVGLELVRRGVQAEPGWVKIGDGEDISTAVDSFVEKYPYLAPGGQNGDYEEETRPGAPAALPPAPRNANVPGPPARSGLRHRNIEEVKKDPKARRQFVDEFRGVLGYSE